jgi:hypothetical protein
MARSRLLDHHFAGAQHGIDIGRHASGTDAVRKQEFWDEIEVAALGDIQVELQIFTARGSSGSECRIIASHRFSAAFSNQGCAAGEKISYNQSGVDATPKIARRNIPEHAVLLVDSPRPAIDQPNPIPTVPHDRHLLPDLLRMPEVVGVDGSNELSARMRNSMVAS